MKKRNLLIVLAGLFILIGTKASAQMVGDNVFLKGKYVEVGIAPNGGYGSTLPAPSNYHPYLGGGSITFYDPDLADFTTSDSLLGFVADYGRDGWTVGTPPFFGDYYLPGTPQEGWGIQVSSTEADAYIPNYWGVTTGYSGAGGALLSGTNIAYQNFGGVSKGIWSGDYGSLHMRQTTTLDTNKLYFTINVVMVNTGTTPLDNIYYVRTLDPDNEETRTSDFSTDNTITYQLPNPGNKVLVSAVGTSTSFTTNAYLGLGTKDCRAKCMYFNSGLAPGYSLDDMFNESTAYTYTQGSHHASDVGIALVYNIGTLGAGDSTTLTYAYILNAAYIDSALDATSPEFLVNSDPFLSGDTINICNYSHDSAVISVGSAGYYSWHWSPDILLDDTTGHMNLIDVNSIVGTVTYTITGINISGGCDTVNYMLTFTRDTFSIDVITPDTTICFGDSVQTTVSGPAHLAYSWLPTSGVSNPNIKEPTIHPLVTTTYTVTASSASGCPSESATITITVNNPQITSVNTSNPTVCGYYDGTITLRGLTPGAIDSVYYSKNGVVQTPLSSVVNPDNTILMTGLGYGNYTNIFVKVGSCYTNAVAALLTNPPKPVVTVDSDLVLTCVGIPVLLHAYVAVTPAGTPINYSWTPPVGLSSVTIADPTVTPIAPGDVYYRVITSPDTVTVCWDTATVHVHTIGDFTLNNHDTIVCINNTIHGNITGSGEINYAWTPSAGVVTATIPNPVFLDTLPGIITYTVTGSYAHCPDYVHSFTIEVDTPARAIVITDTLCLGMTDSFNFAVPGSDYYHYQWIADPPTGISFSNDTIPNPIITPTTTGFYNIAVSIHPLALACTIMDYVHLDVLPNAISVSPTDTSVCSSKVIQVIGNGDPTFNYQWLPTAGIPVSNVLNALIHPDTTTDYTVVASFHRCPDFYAYLHVHVDPQPSVYIGGYRFVCETDTIHINTSVTPATGSYSYTWTPATGLDNTTSNTVVFNGTTSGMIYVSVNTLTSITTLDTTCRALDSAFVTVYPGPSASIISQDFCPHDSSVLTPTPASASYHWYPSYYLSDSMSSTPVIKPITTQVYTVVASTDHGCKDTISFTATVHPAATILLPDSVTLYPGESYNIEPVTNCVTFSWFPPAGLSSTIISNPVATPELSTKYIVTGTTENGCVTTDSISIIVDGESLLAMPNAFTPGTGANNVYKILLRGVAQINYFRIYNRWGNLVFETKNINEGWDGNYKGQAQPMDAYIYEVQAVAANGKIITKHGNITLLR